MATIYNDTPNNRYIGGRCIPPGEFGEIPDELAGDAIAVADQIPIEPVSIAQLLEGLVRDIQPLLGAMSDDELAEVKRLETAGQARKRILAEVEEIQAQRLASAEPAEAAVESAQADQAADEVQAEPAAA
ncbi:MAG: hypothetical protein RIR00_2700 [Pseudomonadota bacterium]